MFEWPTLSPNLSQISSRFSSRFLPWIGIGARSARRGRGRWVADAGVSVHDLSAVLGEPVHEGDGDFDSLGGMIVELVGRVPSTGERVRSLAFDLVVLEADERRVTRVEIVRTRPEPMAVAG